MAYMSLKKVLHLGTRECMTILAYTDDNIGRTQQIMNDDCIIWILSKTQFILTPNLVKDIMERFSLSRIEARNAINISPHDSTYEIRFQNSLIDDIVFKFVYLHPDFLRKNKDNKVLFKLMLPVIHGRNIPESLMCPVISDYCKADADVTKYIFDSQEQEEMISMMRIKNVVFNEPATIVMWEDGTKTVVKCQGDEVFDKEKGLAMCFMKKLLGNKGNYYEIVKKWTSEQKVEKPKRDNNKELDKKLKRKEDKKLKRKEQMDFIRKNYREFGGSLTVRQISTYLALGRTTVHRLICVIREEDK